MKTITKNKKSTKVGRVAHKSGFVKKGLDLLIMFVREPWRRFSVYDVKKISKNKSNHYVHDTIKKFVMGGILKEEKKGSAYSYFIDYTNKSKINYLSFVESLIKEQRKDIPYKNLKKISDKIKSPFYCLAIGGSYAEKKQKKNSDMDVAIIIPDSEQKKPYEIALREGELMAPEVHGFVFTREEFYLMLTNKEYNYGKELARKHVIVYGAEPYYRILFEAMELGFKG